MRLVTFVFLCFLMMGRVQAMPDEEGNRLAVEPPDSLMQPIYLADPTIFFEEGTYYLYGTNGFGSNQGFPVYTSTSPNLRTWKNPSDSGMTWALKKGDAYGTSGFWAPQIFKYRDTFYMAYVANEHIAIAKSNHPLGPFTQKKSKAFSSSARIIDPFVFIDTDGRKYLYHVRLEEGNRIYVAELNDDLTGFIPGTLHPCVNAAENVQNWENTENVPWSVSEGPTVLKHKGWYYLFYSANDFRNPDYAVGYAVARNPLGPWKKYQGNPILNKTLIGENGPGHGDFIKNEQGQYFYIFHTHHSADKVSPRKTALIKGNFERDDNREMDEMKFDKDSFHYLELRRE